MVVEPLSNHYVAAGYRVGAGGTGAPALRRRHRSAHRRDRRRSGHTAGRRPLRGRGRALQEPVEQASRLTVGEPYRRADVDAARRRIEAVYRRVAITTWSSRRAWPSTRRRRGQVAFAVTPGPRAATLRRRRVRASNGPGPGKSSTRSTSIRVPRWTSANGRRPASASTTPTCSVRWRSGPRKWPARRTPRPPAGARPGHGHRVAGMAAALRPAVDRLRPDRVMARRWPSAATTSASSPTRRTATSSAGPSPWASTRRVERHAASNSTYLSFPTLFGRARADQLLRVRRAPGSLLDDYPDPDLLAGAAESRSSSASAACGGSRPATATGSPTKCSMPSTRRTCSSSTR